MYGVQLRYLFEIDITENDMKKAIFDADCVMGFVLHKIQLTK